MRPSPALLPLTLISALLTGCGLHMNLTGCASAHRASEERMTSTDHVAGAPIAVHTRNGAVEILGDPQTDGVQIVAKITCAGETQEEAEQRLGQATLNIERSADNTLTISPEFPGGPRSNDGASFTIRLPDADGVDVGTSNGRVQISGLRGQATLNTSNGGVTIENHDGTVDIATSNGRINIDGLTGDLKAVTSNGSVDISQLAGSAQVDSSNGAITIALAPDHAGPVDVRTSNGTIRAKVGRGFAGKVKFDTSNGSIRIADAAGRVTSQNIAKTSGEATIGPGGATSVLDTSNGSIEFEIQ